MLFSSTTFFIFFAIYLCAHLLLARAYRVYLIIFGSAVFYGWWNPWYVWLPFVLIALAYFGVDWIVGAESPTQSRRRLALVIVGLFTPLFFFKYTDFFFADVLGPLFGWQGRIVGLPLPLGVSFVTFTLTAYIVDIYRKQFENRQKPSELAAYVTFFPHLIAGPILRPHELIPQIQHPRPALAAPFVLGFTIFTVGLVKKIVFADQVAPVVDSIYSQSAPIGGPSALLAIYGFSLQIYCDFSGYTDMAIGLALMLGIKLPNNFLRPYAAGNLIEFWRRWHITLSTWLRDYLYIPLGGNRGGRPAQIRNLLITMILGGLWHGANWTFVVWGALHGVGLATVHLFRASPMATMLRSMPRWLGVLLTFHFVSVAWIFFRAPNLPRALEILQSVFHGGWDEVSKVTDTHRGTLVLLALFFLMHGLDHHTRIKIALRRWRLAVVWPLIALLLALVLTINHGSSAKFIYFDF